MGEGQPSVADMNEVHTMRHALKANRLRGDRLLQTNTQDMHVSQFSELWTQRTAS
jgi:hypothetical protein